jgi:Protein of unknown function (DUF3987)
LQTIPGPRRLRANLSDLIVFFKEKLLNLNGSNGHHAGLENQPGCDQPTTDTRKGTWPSPESMSRVAALREENARRIQIPFDETPAPFWPEPDAIEERLPAVPDFDPELLPVALRPLVEDTADRMQVPLDFPAVTAIIALAGAVNRRASIQPKRADHGWIVVPNLWGGIVASPGQKKSPTIAAMTAPLRAIEKSWREEYAKSTTIHGLQIEEAELVTSAWKESFKRATMKKQERPPRPEFDLKPPVPKRMLTSDGTFEALHALLAVNPAGLFVLRDELTGWLASLERQGREDQRAFYLESWNGDSSFTVDRIIRGSIHVEHCCISLFGGIQPSRLRAYLADVLEDGPSNDGLIQRFQLLIWPDPLADWSYRDRAPSAVARQQANAVYCRLAAMDADNPTRFHFADDAQELFIAWLTKLERDLASDVMNPVMVAHLAKYRSLMPSLALLLALADGCEGEIPLIHARQAARWCEYLKYHAQRIYAAKLAPERSAAIALAKRLRDGWKSRETEFTLRDVYAHDWAELDTPDQARGALQVLEETGWIRKNPQSPRPGRPAESWCINPRIYGGGL